MAMLMPAMLLTTACSSSDDDDVVINHGETAQKGYAIPVTVNVTCEGFDATTRATYNDGTNKLSFSTGDKLFVSGVNASANVNTGWFAGLLEWQSGGTFSGTIYTQNEVPGTADALFTAASASGIVKATLLPNGYESYNFLSIYNNGSDDLYDDVVAWSMQKAFVASETAKATGVEQLSFERATTYSSGFALAPANAILNFTISGLEAGAQDVTLSIDYGGVEYPVTGSVTPNASGVATFAIGVPVGANIKEMSNNLTVGSSNFTLPSSTTFAAGKIYNITRAAAPAPSYTMAAAATTSDKGKLICTAGHIHVYGEDAACTAGRVAKIIYVGTNGHATYNHGLALALVDMSTKLTWDNSGTDNDGKTAAEWCSAWNTSKPVNAAEWLLASKDQWDYMLGTSGAGSYTTLRDGFESVGGSNMKMARYWSSMEFDSYRGMYYQFSRGEWDFEFKNENYYVRAALAF